jgi:hypothetical protein
VGCGIFDGSGRGGDKWGWFIVIIIVWKYI